MLSWVCSAYFLSINLLNGTFGVTQLGEFKLNNHDLIAHAKRQINTMLYVFTMGI